MQDYERVLAHKDTNILKISEIGVTFRITAVPLKPH